MPAVQGDLKILVCPPEEAVLPVLLWLSLSSTTAPRQRVFHLHKQAIPDALGAHPAQAVRVVQDPLPVALVAAVLRARPGHQELDQVVLGQVVLDQILWGR